MGLHGLHRELKAIGDFLGTVTPGDKLQDLTLPRRKVVGLGLLAPDPLHVALHHLLRYARAEIGFALRHRLQRELQFAAPVARIPRWRAWKASPRASPEAPA